MPTKLREKKVEKIEYPKANKPTNKTPKNKLKRKGQNTAQSKAMRVYRDRRNLFKIIRSGKYN